MFVIEFYNFSFLLLIIVHFEKTWNYDMNFNVSVTSSYNYFPDILQYHTFK